MKIITRDEFLKLGERVLYSKYEPCVFEEMLIKENSIDNDWFYSEIRSAIKCSGSGEMSDLLFKAEEDGISLDMDFDMQSRDGCFEEDELFAIYEKKDIEQLIEKLKECIEGEK